MKKIIRMPEKFDFETNVWFRDQVKDQTEVEFDFSICKYLDSSGLGMLLVARDKIGKDNVSITNAHGDVKKVLDIANFQKLFKIN